MFASSSNNSRSETNTPTGQKTNARYYTPGDVHLEDLELGFLRVVGRNRVPIASIDEIQFDTPDGQAGKPIEGGATMEVHKASWKGQKVVVKYVHKSYTGQAYRRAFYNLNFELQLMSKPSLRKQRNIPSLLAVCFSKDDDLTTCLEASASVVRPGLAVELAHEQYPDLRHFFDRARNMFRPKQLPFETSATSAALIADIADGMAALHHHDIVHADLKPENILLYPDSQSPNGLVAKVADFGLVGMTTYRDDGLRAPLPDGRPRGGTAEWSAPECLVEPDYWMSKRSLKHPSYEVCSDIYSFGLVSCYIALDGQTPTEFVPNLSRAKLTDTLLDIAVARLRSHYRQRVPDAGKSLVEVAVHIAQQTLKLESNGRMQSLQPIRALLLGL